ncbi:MAG TPA: autotransporter domain-containing protein [Phenylobacterium sp.]
MGTAQTGGGAGGGGGGIIAVGAATLDLSGTSSVTGGAGGTGGASGLVNNGAQSPRSGGGGGGGAGIALQGGGSLTLAAGTVDTGGSGGTGGAGPDNTVNPGGQGGDGGGGGTGVIASGATITNSGTISGGAGGLGGTGGTGPGGSAPAGSNGVGGAGIVGSGLTVINSGIITGGSAGGGGAQANAITFTGGANTLTLQGGSTINGNIAVTGSLNFSQGTNVTLSNAITGTGSVSKSGAGTLTLTGANTFGGGLAINGGTVAAASNLNLGGGGLSFNGGTLQATGVLALGDPITLNAGGGTIDTNGNAAVVTSVISGAGGLIKNGNGQLTFQNAMAYTGGTTINAGTLFLDSIGGMLPTGGALAVNGGLLDMSFSGADQSVGALSGTGGTIDLGPQTLTTNSSSSTTLATQIIGTGALVKQGSGTLTLTGSNTYSGGTQIQGGLINFNALNNFGTGTITLSGGGLQWASGSTLDISSRLVLGPGGGTFDTNGNNLTFASGMSGTGGLTKQGSGILNLTGANTYTGATSVTAGTLAVNGTVTSNVTVGAGGTLGGTGTIFGATTIQGTLAPGNSIGTLNVSGNFIQGAGSIYQVEANAAGQADRVNVTGTATINGGTVQVVAASGTYGTSTTYTILSANGGRTGTYSGVTSNFAFLTPSLTYDANNVFLTLALLGGGGGSGSGFLMSAYTPNQKAVGYALNQSFASASGDYSTVINALASLNAFAGPAALNAISGEQYADFGTMNLNNSALFMNAIGQQMALARGVAASGGQRASLAEACDGATCDGISPFSVWGSLLGGVGSVSGDSNASTTTYNFGGAAVGIDYRLDPRFLVGVATTYTTGNLWVNSFPGKGWSNNVGVAAYGSFTPMGSGPGFYADLLGGYAYFNNQLQRQIVISGLPTRTSSGSTGANQALGQVEAGYRFGLYAPAAATIAPFARLQGSSTTQNAFSEWGAQSLSLNVAQQTTNSLRSLFGIDLASALPIGNERTVDVGLRLGWQHEFAYTGRPITAALSGAPFAAFTVYGATPQTDSAVVSFRANTRVADQVQLYLRYDGDIGSGTDNHALNLGLRVSW